MDLERHSCDERYEKWCLLYFWRMRLRNLFRYFDLPGSCTKILGIWNEIFSSFTSLFFLDSLSCSANSSLDKPLTSGRRLSFAHISPWPIRFLFVRTHFESARKKKHAINRIRNTLVDESTLHQHNHWRYILEQKPRWVLDIAESSSQRSQCIGAKILMNALSLSDLCTDRSTMYKNIWNSTSTIFVTGVLALFLHQDLQLLVTVCQSVDGRDIEIDREG